MRIWILGAEGLVGKALVRKCIEKNIDHIPTGRALADLTDLEGLKRFCDKEPCTHIINCASYTDVDKAETESKLAYAVNAKGPKHLGILATLFPLHILHLSTDYVFDGLKRAPYTEEDPPHPLSVYGKSKWEGELELFDRFAKAAVVRTSWVIGEGGKSFISRLPYLILEKEIISSYNEQVSSPTYVEDLTETLLSLLSCVGVWHVANQGAATREEIYQRYFREMKSREKLVKAKAFISISLAKEQAPRPAYSVLGIDKLQKFGITMRPWQETIGEYIDGLHLPV